VLDVRPVPIVELCVTVLPNGFVLLGLEGIKLSKLTNDEFSPKNDSGVFRVGFTVLFELFILLLNASCIVALLIVELFVLFVLFHGFVEFLLLSEFDETPPKKSPNGSLALELLLIAPVLVFVGVFTLFVVNKSNSSILFDDDLLFELADDDHGSFVILFVGSQGFVVADATGEVFHGSFMRPFVFLASFVAHGSFKSLFADVATPEDDVEGFKDDNGGKKSSILSFDDF
jgi:hypothetical protein